MENKLSIGNILSGLFGLVVLAIGFVNTFWGNDPQFGIFMLLLALVYFAPFDTLFKRITGRSIPLAVKIALALFILWAALGVGELFDKIDLMLGNI